MFTKLMQEPTNRAMNLVTVTGHTVVFHDDLLYQTPALRIFGHHTTKSCNTIVQQVSLWVEVLGTIGA